MAKSSRAPKDLKGGSRHPARSRRKAKRRPRSPSIWQTPTYWNLLTFPALLLVVLIGQALIMSPLFLDLPFLDQHPWLAVPLVLGFLTAVALLCLLPFMHLHWNVTDQQIKSTQPARGGSFSLTWPNADFIALEPCGPLIRVRRQTGEVYLWPRWLRRSGRTYEFELHEPGLRLRPLMRDQGLDGG